MGHPPPKLIGRNHKNSAHQARFFVAKRSRFPGRLVSGIGYPDSASAASGVVKLKAPMARWGARLGVDGAHSTPVREAVATTHGAPYRHPKTKTAKHRAVRQSSPQHENQKEPNKKYFLISGELASSGSVMEQYHCTTIISVRRQTADGIQVAIGGDGQVTLGHIVVKGTARKVRKLYNGRVLGGFAGATADAFTLFERFEAKLEKHNGQLTRAAIELTKEWRTDRVLRRLEAMLAVADETASLIITGNGDVLEPEQGIVAIGSGGAYAHSAAKALLNNTDLSAEEIVRKSLEIAGELCIYTNMHHTIETL